jgi:hypothetical protein
LNYNIKIVVPIYRAFSNLDDFSNLNRKVYNFENEFIKGSFTVYYYEECNNETAKNFFSVQEYTNYSFWYGRSLKYHYLEFIFNILKVNEENLKEKEEMSEEEWKSLLYSCVRSFCEDEYKLFVFTCFLAFPVSTCFEHGVLLQDNRPSAHIDKYLNIFDFDKNKKINFQKCWDYLHDMSKFRAGRSQNNASRFISIMSEIILRDDDIVSNIFYSSMALESVFARGTSESISRQIIDKARIFLNAEIEEKKLKRLYDVRSRYIHGDADILLSFLDYEFDKKDELYQLFFYVSEILFMIAKRIIEENISTIDFEYNIRLS